MRLFCCWSVGGGVGGCVCLLTVVVLGIGSVWPSSKAACIAFTSEICVIAAGGGSRGPHPGPVRSVSAMWLASWSLIGWPVFRKELKLMLSSFLDVRCGNVRWSCEMCVGVAGGILCARSMVRLIGGPCIGGCGLLMVLGRVLLFCCCCGLECCCAKIVVRLMGVVHGCCPLLVGGL